MLYRATSHLGSSVSAAVSTGSDASGSPMRDSKYLIIFFKS